MAANFRLVHYLSNTLLSNTLLAAKRYARQSAECQPARDLGPGSTLNIDAFSLGKSTSPRSRSISSKCSYHVSVHQGERHHETFVERIIARVEVGEQGPDTRFVVTNLKKGTPRRLYCRRGQAENHIKSWKTHLAADRTSCTKATANRLRLFLHAGSYWLMWGPAHGHAEAINMAPRPVRHLAPAPHQNRSPRRRNEDLDPHPLANGLSEPENHADRPLTNPAPPHLIGGARRPRNQTLPVNLQAFVNPTSGSYRGAAAARPPTPESDIPARDGQRAE